MGNKRHQINVKPKKNTDTTADISRNRKYLAYLLENKILNTNAVVGENVPTFQGYANMYLDVTNLRGEVKPGQKELDDHPFLSEKDRDANKAKFTKFLEAQQKKQEVQREDVAKAAAQKKKETPKVQVTVQVPKKLPKIVIPTKGKENKQATLDAAKTLREQFDDTSITFESTKGSPITIERNTTTSNSKSPFYKATEIPLGAFGTYTARAAGVNNQLISSQGILANKDGSVTFSFNLSLEENSDLHTPVKVTLQVNDTLQEYFDAINERNALQTKLIEEGWKDVAEQLRGKEASIALKANIIGNVIIKGINNNFNQSSETLQKSSEIIRKSQKKVVSLPEEFIPIGEVEYSGKKVNIDKFKQQSVSSDKMSDEVTAKVVTELFTTLKNNNLIKMGKSYTVLMQGTNQEKFVKLKALAEKHNIAVDNIITKCS
jgi:hypothetical protein